MAEFDIETIDITPYQSAPLLPTEATVSLADSLNEVKPEPAPEQVKKAALRMIGSADAIRQELVERIESAGLSAASEAAFDSISDRFWAATRSHLGYWMLFDSDALALLSEEQQDQLDLEDKREKASLARELDNHLFGGDGLAFLRKPYPQQVELMASRLTFIANSDKAALYQEVLGHELLATLEVLQARYQSMVRARSSRVDSSVSLRTLRFRLQRHIQLYAAAVLTMLDEDDASSVEVVINALRPMVNARVRRTRPADTVADTEDAATEPEAEVTDAQAEAPEADVDLEFDDEQD